MLSPRLTFVAIWLANALASVQAATGGSFQSGGNTQISALMMFLGNENSVYILDKAEGNAAQILGHPAWGAVWDISSRTTTLMDIKTNSFCASGMHLPNGTFASFGGNDAVGVGGSAGSQKNTDGRTGLWDAVYQDFDGRKAIRLLNPCTAQDNLAANAPCGWYDEPQQLSMKKNRWYSGTESLGDGSVLILGGMVTGGYVNRWLPDNDPVTEGGAAENTYEYYPARGGDPPIVQFLVDNSPLNVYSHMYLMASGKVLVQAGTSTMLWDHANNAETALPPMPNGVVRVYPASGATAMLPLTKQNQWTPTLLFCGGSNMPLASYGDYVGPRADTWTIPAVKDCQRLTPEPTDGSTVAYQADDDMLDGRTMGQFIIMPDGKMLMVNGGAKGTAGYAANGTPNTPVNKMPFGVGLAADPVLTPAIYDPNAPQGSRWSNAGLSASQIPRLYHSTAILLPDASIFIAGSNPNPDVDLKAFYATEYRAEVFYPPYFNAPLRPMPTGMPKTLSYGGNPFDITIPTTSYTGVANDAADNTTVVVVRGGFTTHGMNMGQRFLQLDNSYTVNQDGSITLHVAQMPPNANIFQPGPALMFVVMNGIPSNGTYVIIGTGNIEAQPLGSAASLPANVRLDGVVGGTQTTTGSKPGATGGTKSSDDSKTDEKSSSTTRIAIIAGAAGGAVLLAALAGLCIARRRRAAARQKATGQFEVSMAAAGVRPRVPFMSRDNTSSSVFSPLNNQRKYDHEDDTWDPSTASLNAPYGPYRDSSYRDSMHSATPSGNTDYYDAVPFDPYAPNSQTGMGFPSPSHAVGSSVHVPSSSNLRNEYHES